MRKPDWIGIGVQKGGSSWVYLQLARHPQVRVPVIRGIMKKEFHAFDLLNISSRHYFWAFDRISSQYKTGEFTPGYFAVPYTPCLISEFCPDVKLFVIFRNPVDRAFSHYKDHLYLKKIPPGVSFKDAFDWNYPQNEQRYSTIKERGMYANQLKNWYAHFDPKRIKTMWYDDMIEDPIKFIKELYEWVELDSSFIPKRYKERVVKSYNIAFGDMKMSKEDKEYVGSFYIDQIKYLGELTKRDLSAWYK